MFHFPIILLTVYWAVVCFLTCWTNFMLSFSFRRPTITAFEWMSSLNCQFSLFLFLINVFEVFRSCIEWIAIERFDLRSNLLLFWAFLWGILVCEMVLGLDIEVLIPFLVNFLSFVNDVNRNLDLSFKLFIFFILFDSLQPIFHYPKSYMRKQWR